MIELIAALLIIAVLAAMIFPVTRYGPEQTARGVVDCRELFELQGQMEKIVLTYKNQLATGIAGDIDLQTFWNTVSVYPYVDTVNSGFIEESGGALNLTSDTSSSLFLVTLVNGDQRIGSIFSK